MRRYSRNTLLKQSLYTPGWLLRSWSSLKVNPTARSYSDYIGQDGLFTSHHLGYMHLEFSWDSKKVLLCHIYCTFLSSDLQDVSSYLFSLMSFPVQYFSFFNSILVYFSNNLILQTSPSFLSLLFSIFPTFLPFLYGFYGNAIMVNYNLHLLVSWIPQKPSFMFILNAIFLQTCSS